MGREERSAGCLNSLPEKWQFVHSEDVLLQSKGQEMPLFRVYLAAGEEQDAVTTSETGQGVGVPEGVVFGETETVQAKALGLQDQLLRGLEGVVGEGSGVGVQVYEHEGDYSLPDVAGAAGRLSALGVAIDLQSLPQLVLFSRCRRFSMVDSSGNGPDSLSPTNGITLLAFVIQVPKGRLTQLGLTPTISLYLFGIFTMPWMSGACSGFS